MGEVEWQSNSNVLIGYNLTFKWRRGKELEDNGPTFGQSLSSTTRRIDRWICLGKTMEQFQLLDGWAPGIEVH